MAVLPVVVLLGEALEHAALDDAVLEHVEPDLLVLRQVEERPPEAGALLHVLPPVRVRPFDVYGVEGVLLTLEPVAGQVGDRDVADGVVPNEGLPQRQERDGGRAEVGEHEAPRSLHRIARNLDLLLEAAVGAHRLLERLLDALARLVVAPAMVHATQAMLFGDAVREVDAAMRAQPRDEPERPRPVAVEDEVFAEQAHGLRRPVVELSGGGDGVPVAAHQLAHRRAGADLRERSVVLDAEHGQSPRT